MAMKECPVCGVSVKMENLERHVKNQHPRADVDLKQLLTSEERREVDEARASTRPALTQAGKRWIVIVAVVVAAILVAAVALTLWRGSGASVGQTAPDFTLTTSVGGTVTLSGYRGQPVFLEFMDVDCEWCQRQAGQLTAYVWPHFQSQVAFLSVDINSVGTADDASRIGDFKTTYGTPWTYALDLGRTVAARYGFPSVTFSGTPTTFILDRNGVIVQIFSGYDSYSNLSSALNRTLG